MKILKKSLALIVALAMLASLVVVSVVATDPVATISLVPKSSVLANGQVEIDIVVANNPGMIQNKLFMNYNTDVFDFESYTHNADLAGALEISANSWLPGKPGWEEGYITLVYGSGLLYEDNTVSGTIGTLTFTIKDGTAVGNYDIAFNARNATDQTNAALADVPFTYVGGVVNVIEENWISSTGEVKFDDIEYGAEVSELPDTVKGVGQTSGGTPILATDDPGVVLNVEWDEIDTLVDPAEGLSVVGTVTTEENEVLKYKNADGEPIAAPAATATYDIIKSSAGVVAPVEIDVEARFGGEAVAVADIVELAEVVAVETTTIKLDNPDAEEETVELDWEAAEVADAADATLNLGTAEDSIMLNVPVIPVGDETTYYNLDEKTAEVTITVKSAVMMYNATEAVTVETAVEYGEESELVLPETVKGLGETEGGQEITAEYSDEFEVVWDDIATLQAPGVKTVNGTVAEPADALIKFKNNDYTEDVDSLTAVASYRVEKSTKGVVAPVETIEVKAKEAGVETDIEGLKALEEITTAVTTTTIKLDNADAEEETITLNWAAAEVADEADATLNLGSESDSIVLKVPVMGDTVYYNLQGKFVAVTIQMTPAYRIGDANGDGDVNSADDIIFQRHFAGWPAYAELPNGVGDANNDGDVNSADDIIFQRYFAGWPAYSELPYIPAQ